MGADARQPAGRSVSHLEPHEAHLIGSSALVHGTDDKHDARRGLRSVVVADSLNSACSVIGDNCYVEKQFIGKAFYSENARSNFNGMVLEGAVVPEYRDEALGVPERPRGKKVLNSMDSSPMAAVLEQVPPEKVADGLRTAIDETSRNIDETVLAADRAHFDSHQMAAAINGVAPEDTQSRRGVTQNEDSRRMAAVLEHAPLDALDGLRWTVGESLRNVADEGTAAAERALFDSHQVAAALHGAPAECARSRRVMLPSEGRQVDSHEIAAAISGVPAIAVQSRRQLLPNEDSRAVAKAMNGIPMPPELGRQLLPNDNSSQVAMAIRGAPLEPDIRDHGLIPPKQLSHLTAAGGALAQDGVGQRMAIPGNNCQTAQSLSRQHPQHSSFHSCGAGRQAGPPGALVAVGSMVASPRGGAPVVQTDPIGLRLPINRARLLHLQPQ